MKLLILYNAYSGGGKGRMLAKKMKARLHSMGLAFDAFKNDWPPGLDGYREVLLFGGDGTLNYFINKYGIADIPITLFPGGTGNDLHWKLFGNLSADAQINNWQSYPVCQVDVGQCNNTHFINMVGLGFDGEVLRRMKAIRWIGGHLGYLIIVIRTIFTYREKTFTLRWDNESAITVDLILCHITNSSRTGGGFMVAPHALINDGLLNLIYACPKSVIKRLFFLPGVEKGSHLKDPDVFCHEIKKLTISAKEEVPYQLDGELRYDHTFEIVLAEKKQYMRSNQLLQTTH